MASVFAVPTVVARHGISTWPEIGGTLEQRQRRPLTRRRHTLYIAVTVSRLLEVFCLGHRA